jgi:BirA family transcriptional regulator, biotin operon repressor / biotin---[acetyl-CoA-carboxylase] ligase
VSELGHPRIHLRRTDSTNSRARELALAGAPHGTLVTAAEQLAGRGRQGRSWSAPAGCSLLCSLVLRRPPQLLPLLGAVAVCDVVGPQARVKWPNDIVLERTPGLAKLGGILIEGRPQEGWAVLGIGLNVAVSLDQLPLKLRCTAASMKLRPQAIEPLLGRLLGELERRLGEPATATLEAWRERDALLGRRVSWAQGSGLAAGIDGAGRLIVSRDDGARVTLDAGEVHLDYSPA